MSTFYLVQFIYEIGFIAFCHTLFNQMVLRLFISEYVSDIYLWKCIFEEYICNLMFYFFFEPKNCIKVAFRARHNWEIPCSWGVYLTVKFVSLFKTFWYRSWPWDFRNLVFIKFCPIVCWVSDFLHLLMILEHIDKHLRGVK